MFIPFHVINVVISEALTFFIFGWYLIAPNPATPVFVFAHLQVIIEHFLVGSFIEKTNYAAPKTVVRIFKLVDLDFKTLVNTYMGNPKTAPLRRAVTVATVYGATTIAAGAEDIYATTLADIGLEKLKELGVDYSKMDPEKVHQLRESLRESHSKHMPITSAAKFNGTLFDAIQAKASIGSQGATLDVGLNSDENKKYIEDLLAKSGPSDKKP
jgi:hypothetical protein